MTDGLSGGVAPFAAISVVAAGGHTGGIHIPELAERFSAAAKKIAYRGVTLETEGQKKEPLGAGLN